MTQKQSRLPWEFLPLEMLRVTLVDVSVQEADVKMKSDMQEIYWAAPCL